MFSEGASASRSIPETAGVGTSLGNAVRATDADTGDTLTYTLSGTDAASFRINSANGQLSTGVALDADVKASYSVSVNASDGKATATIAVTVTVTPVTNSAPVFAGVSATRSVAETAATGDSVGDPVIAIDPDGNALTYRMGGTDAASFIIIAATGQIQTLVPLDYETKSFYVVQVTANDGLVDSIPITVIITVTDVGAPAAPDAPTVLGESSTSLSVSWTEPADTLPAISDYDYRYKESAVSAWTTVDDTTITDTSVTISSLSSSAAHTSYDVQVRATNAEGTGAWSASGTGDTNNPPTFSDGASADRRVSAGAPAGAAVGEPVPATDADDDSLAYSLAGTDAASFDIDAATAQIRTKDGVTLTVGDTYSVMVVANDGIRDVSIDVTVTAIANNAPVFSEGTAAARSVTETAPVGSPVGNPVVATDADTGDSVTYMLQGTDAGSFSIDSANGQLLTSVALDADVKASYSVTVAASDGKDIVIIAVTVTVEPVKFYGCDKRGAVTDPDENPGLVADCENLLRSLDALEGGAFVLNWSAFRPIKDWRGVTLRGTPLRVTHLNLRSLGLKGTIPAELGELTMLQRLWLHNNSLSGPLPNLGRLQDLQSLYLSGRDMNLTGNISWLGSLTEVHTVSVWGNSLSGPIPDLSRLTKLELLKLQSNEFTGGIPASLGNMESVRGLYLQDNPLGGSIPRELANLGDTLTILAIHKAELTGPIPDLRGLTKLRTISLYDNNLTGPVPGWLASIDSLVKIRLHNNQLTGTIPSELGTLPNLNWLVLSNNQLTGTIPRELGGLSKLTLLWLHNNQLTGAIPTQLGDLGDTLTHIKLAGNSFATDACLPAGIASVTNNDYADAGLSACP